jgi:putative choline sulfate-utilization transcription factor
MMSTDRLRRKLPPLSSLMAFEAAGRHLNFTLAGKELNVTQAAISRQIHSLEDHLGFPVFIRQHRAVRLTPDGEKFHRVVTMSLQHVAEAAGELQRKANRRTVTVGTTIAFATFWLMPLLNRFRAEDPEVELRLMASDAPIDLLADGVDLAVKYGDGRWPGLDAVYLFRDEIFPVCSPDFLKAHPAADSLAGLPKLPLLELEEVDASWMDWPRWLAAAGIAARPGSRSLVYNNYPLLIQAAVDGHGVALGWRYFVDELLQSGRLVHVTGQTVRTGLGFYLVTPQGETRSAHAVRLHDWLTSRISRDDDSAPGGPLNGCRRSAP